MKSRTYFGLALLTPYALWIICALAAFLLSSLETTPAWDILLMPIMFYAFGILLWFIPYTILAVGMWIWSRSKSTATLFKAAMVAPVVLGILMLLEGLLVNLPASDIAQLGRELPGQVALLGGLSLLFGYFCVGITLGIYKILQARKLIAEETPPQPLSE
jgi:uncharacterized membrane protein YvlD (DUF360 family)